MKRVLIVAECLNKDKTSEGISTSNFLNALGNGPFEIHCLFYQFVQFEINFINHIDNKIILYKIKNSIIDQLIQKLGPIRNRLSEYFGFNLLRFWRSIRFKKNINKLIKSFNYDLIFVRTIAGSFASHVAVHELARNNKIKWIAYFNDPVPVSLMPFPYYVSESKKSKQLKKDESLVKDIILSSNAISSPSHFLNLRFLKFSNLKLSEKKAFLFPHIFINPSHFESSTFLNPSFFNIVHIGSLLKERNPIHLLNAFSAFISNFPSLAVNFRLSFIGNIHPSHLSVFKNFPYQSNLNIINVRVPYEVALNIISTSDIQLILEAVSDESPFMPVKLSDSIGLNKIIWSLSPDFSEIRRILGSKYPYQCKADAVSDIQNHLLHMAKNSKIIKSKGLREFAPGLEKYVCPQSTLSEFLKCLNEDI